MPHESIWKVQIEARIFWPEFYLNMFFLIHGGANVLGLNISSNVFVLFLIFNVDIDRIKVEMFRSSVQNSLKYERKHFLCQF